MPFNWDTPVFDRFYQFNLFSLLKLPQLIELGVDWLFRFFFPGVAYLPPIINKDRITPGVSLLGSHIFFLAIF